MDTLLDRFCRYARVFTQADEKSGTVPSSPGQLELSCMLKDELLALGLRDASHDAHGIVLATLPAAADHPAPIIAWIAHVNASPETTGLHGKPVVHRDCDCDGDDGGRAGAATGRRGRGRRRGAVDLRHRHLR